MFGTTVRYCRVVRKTGNGNGGLRSALSKVSSRLSGPLVLGFLLLSAGCGPAVPPELAPDLILHHGTIITVDPDFRVVEAAAIKGSRFVAVGGNDHVLNLAGSRTLLVDLEGKTAIPGLIDSHIHAFGFGLHNTKHVNFSTGERLTVESMVARIGEWAKNTPPGTWIYGRGPYSLDFVAEGRLPNRWEVDAVTPENPFFMNTQGHVGLVNSYALRQAGITKRTPDPKGGKLVRDPQTGELTGIVYEFPAMNLFRRLIPKYSLEDNLKAVRWANEEFNRLGITSVVNLHMSREELAVLRQLGRDEELTTRWTAFLRTDPKVFVNKSDAEVEAEIRALGPPTRFGNDWLKINGIKIVLDGFVEAAYMREPYLEEVFGRGWRGILLWDRKTLKSVLRGSAKYGIQVAVHVTGDAALDVALEAMDEVDREYSIAGRRWSLEHAGVMPTEKNLEITKRLKIIVSTEQSMGWSIGKTFKQVWGPEMGGIFAPNRSWLQALGHPYLKAGSDNRPVDPFIGFWAYLAREDVDGQVSKSEEALTREDTLRLYTTNGAYGIFEEKDRGSIETGKLADLVVLSEDILSAPESRVREIRSVMTIVGGKTVFQQGP